ncbi:unnamed protein product [Protopolystoma xenopodis]|uniref:Uncharacterized protein n=1 Tax=Protopolystoma xenopodis TaxID=117903 RepID=A0A3S5FGI7_9PLAT|nr:unnamed protein product [Protopolystoma xenopodis]
MSLPPARRGATLPLKGEPIRVRVRVLRRKDDSSASIWLSLGVGRSDDSQMIAFPVPSRHRVCLSRRAMCSACAIWPPQRACVCVRACVYTTTVTGCNCNKRHRHRKCDIQHVPTTTNSGCFGDDVNWAEGPKRPAKLPRSCFARPTALSSHPRGRQQHHQSRRHGSQIDL